MLCFCNNAEQQQDIIVDQNRDQTEQQKTDGVITDEMESVDSVIINASENLDKSVPKSPDVNHTGQLEQVDTESKNKESMDKPALEEEADYGDRIEQIGNEVLAGPHDAFDVLLRSLVDVKGNVNYKAFKARKSELDAYLNTLSSTDIKSLSANEALAFWINVYNAFTIKLIIDNYPLSSIIDLDNGKVWDRKWIELDSGVYSLNQIENEIIRPEFKESRIHFAVNCAAKSCPPLLNQAWTADNLEELFEKQTAAFINNNSYNVISSSVCKLSKIFEWYAEDFGDIRTYINKYSKTKIDSDTEIVYLEYDWSLNGK